MNERLEKRVNEQLLNKLLLEAYQYYSIVPSDHLISNWGHNKPTSPTPCDVRIEKPFDERIIRWRKYLFKMSIKDPKVALYNLRIKSMNAERAWNQWAYLFPYKYSSKISMTEREKGQILNKEGS